MREILIGVTLVGALGLFIVLVARFFDVENTGIAVTQPAETRQIIWTVSGPFEALGSQGVAEMFLLENPAIGYRLVSKNEIAGLEAQEPVKKIIPYAVRESSVGAVILYTSVLRLPQK